MSYAQLQTDSLAWLNRAGDADAIARCPMWIRLAESELRMALSRLMVTFGETVDHNFIIDDEYNDLPDDFIRMRVIRINGNPNKELQYIAPNAVERFQLLTSGTNKPDYYTIQGGKLRVVPTPDDTYTATITYYSLPALSVSNTTNWLLNNYEKIYLCAVLGEAYDYYGAYDKKTAKLQDLDRMLSELEATQSQGAAAGALQQRIDSGCP